MLNLNKYFLLFGIFLLACNANNQEDNESEPVAKVWQMQDGVVVIEVENVEDNNTAEGYWQPVADSLKGYTGSGAFVWQNTGNMYKDPLVIDAPKTDGNYKLTYQIFVPDSGEYVAKVRNYHQLEDGDNDVWFNYNKTIYQKLWDHDPGQWTWSEARANIKTYQPFPLNAGINTINICGRSKGFAIDRIAIFKKGTPEEQWSSPDLPESPLVEADADQEPPAVPAAISIAEEQLSAVLINWSPATDNHQVYGYEIFKNGDKIGFTTDNKYYINQLQPNDEIELAVKSVDFSGNTSDLSASLNYTPRSFSASDDWQITQTKERPMIDGLVENIWQNGKEVALENPAQAGLVNLLYDEDFLYVLVKVEDDEFNDSDGFRLYLDPKHDKTDYLSFNDRIYYYNYGNESLREVISRDDYMQGVEQHITFNDGFYLVEAAIPWQTIGIAPQADNYMGIEIVINDQEGDSRIAKPLIGNLEKELPFYYGSAKLVNQSNL